MIIYLSLIIIIFSTVNGQWDNVQQQRVSPMFGNQFQGRINNNQVRLEPTFRISFPQCLTTQVASNLLNPSTLQNLFQIKLQQENGKLQQERLRNNDLNNSMYKIIYLFNKIIFFIKMILWILMRYNYDQILIMVL
jgi:hypothetical protein